MSRELRDDARRLAPAGMDWPLQGLTMVGLGRLYRPPALRRGVVADGVEGDLIEAGSCRCGASMLMRATLDTLGDERTVHVADSFQGFPCSTDARRPALRVPLVPEQEVRDSFARLGLYAPGSRSVPGFFEQTLSCWLAARGRSSGSTPTATRRPCSRSDCSLPRAGRRRLPGDRRLCVVRRLPPGGRRVPRRARDQ